jgi:cytochrome c
MNGIMRRRLLLISMAAGVTLSGCRATPPCRWEVAMMTRIKHTISVRGAGAKNPLPETSENIAHGKVAFSHYCVACHGLDGQNTGVPFADRMSPPVPSLKANSVQSYKDGQLKWIIENGLAPSGMPASKDILTDNEIWSIVVYIRHLPPAGSLGEPSFYSGE